MRSSPPPPTKEEFACLVDTLFAVAETLRHLTGRMEESPRTQAEAAINAAGIALAPYVAAEPRQQFADIIAFPRRNPGEDR